MDKTFNDLMSIVSRTKKIDEKEGRTKRVVKKVEPVEQEIAQDVNSLFDNANAINKLIGTKKSTSKSTKKATTKPKTTTKSTTKKTTTKKSTTKKSGGGKNTKMTR